jgi:hypothetical protein
MTTGRINQIAFVEKGAGTTDRSEEGSELPHALTTKFSLSSFRTDPPRGGRGYRESAVFKVRRTGLFATSPVSPGSEGRSGPRRAFAACVPVAGADVQDRRGVLP